MIIGHQFQWEYLKKIAEKGEIPHAFLFCGEKQLGKKKVAMEFVKLLFGPAFSQKIEKGVHPDFILIKPDAPKGSKYPTGQARGLIHISQIRELNSRFGFKPSLAPLKVAIIDDAHCMNSAAQSAFLKLLEEPKGRSLFILISSLPNLLLPTILSRTQTIKFYRVPLTEVEKYLSNQNLPKKTSELLLDLYDGRPGLLLENLASPQELEEKMAWVGEINQLIGSDLPFRFKYAESLSKNPQKIDEILEFWLGYFRKKLISHLGQGESQTRLRNILHRLQTIKFLISSTNINPRLALDILMLDF